MFLANWLTNCFFGAKGERQSRSIESQLLPFPHSEALLSCWN
jgi:hypothetical protein